MFTRRNTISNASMNCVPVYIAAFNTKLQYTRCFTAGNTLASFSLYLFLQTRLNLTKLTFSSDLLKKKQPIPALEQMTLHFLGPVFPNLHYQGESTGAGDNAGPWLRNGTTRQRPI